MRSSVDSVEGPVQERMKRRTIGVTSQTIGERVLPPAGFPLVLGFATGEPEGAPVLLDPELKTAIDYGVVGVPETFFVDKEGIIRYKQSGMLTPDILWGEVEELQR